MEALRNSTVPVVEPIQVSDPYPELAALRDKAAQLNKEGNRHNLMCFYSAEFMAMGYDVWKRRSFELHETWWSAHQAWYAAWRQAGFPAGYYY